MLLPPIGRSGTTLRFSCSFCRTFPPSRCPRNELNPQPTGDKSLLLPVEALGRENQVVSVLQTSEIHFPQDGATSANKWKPSRMVSHMKMFHQVFVIKAHLISLVSYSGLR